MTHISLKRRERRFLEDFVTCPCGSRELRRAQALLWLGAGESAEEVAERLCVSRQTVYNWRARFSSRQELEPAARLADGERCGRPRTASGVIEPLIAEVIEEDPREFGYRSTVWTASLLVSYLADFHEVQVSLRSVGYALGREQLRWRRPRHRLALRPETWRQAKGGSSAAFPAESAPSC
jgi:transposase